MAGQTLNRAYPYPTGTDANDVPYRLQALAESVDADVQELADGWATDVDTLRTARGLLQSGTGPAVQTDFTGAAIAVQFGRSYVAGRKYRINAYAEGLQITATGTPTARLAGSADIPASMLYRANNLAVNLYAAGSVVALFEPTTTGARTIQVVVSVAGGGAHRVNANAVHLWVEDVTNG